MSYHLLEDYDMALKILEEFRKTQQVVEYKNPWVFILSKKGIKYNILHIYRGNV